MLVALILGACSHAPLSVRVAGNRLVNGDGDPVRMLGVNRSGGEYACIHALGFFPGPTDKRAIQAMKSWRINAVRVPLNEQCWLGTGAAPAGFSGAAYRAENGVSCDQVRDQKNAENRPRDQARIPPQLIREIG